jgi:hypothetical protein
MRDSVEKPHKISIVAILDKKILGDQTSIGVISDGNGKKRYETYLHTKQR